MHVCIDRLECQCREAKCYTRGYTRITELLNLVKLLDYLS